MRKSTFFVFLFCTIQIFFSQEEKPNRIIENPSTLFSLEEAKHYYTEGKIMAALNLFRAIEAKDDRSAKTKYWISLSYFRLNNYTMA